MSWRVATSLDVLLAEVNKAAPNRSKASDGSIGDAAHASRSSDHNPFVIVRGTGVVRARDFTHDPRNGFDADRFADAVVALGKAGHPALGTGSYVIRNRRIASATQDGMPWDWEPYGGSNPHEKHAHVSVSLSPYGFDSDDPWGVMAAPAPVTKAPISLSRTAEQFHNARESRKVRKLVGVARIQHRLNVLYDTRLLEDGYVGVRTLNAWGYHESRVDTARTRIDRPRVPDEASLAALVKGSRFRMVK